jgi:predicted amidophosphoribosyltransferase
LPPQWAAEAVCLSCLKDPPPFRMARAPYRYADTARATVLAFKNGEEHLAPMIARAMIADSSGLGPDTGLQSAIVVPVPLHRWRLFWRGYNQSALLARAVADQLGARLLLIDDVLTTGATAQAAAKALRRAGAAAVDVLTYARVAGEGSGSYALENGVKGSDGEG